MGGWFADILIEWIVRMIAKLVHRLRSLSWPVVDATITSSNCPRAGYGCHVADIHYDYEFAGEAFSGLHEEPFLMHSLGQDYVLDHPINSHARIRVKQAAPSVAVFLGR
jgi:hypothetical protein